MRVGGWGYECLCFPFHLHLYTKRCFTTLNILDLSVLPTYVLSLILGSDIVQWMIKNLDIEDQGKKGCSILISGFPSVYGHT